MYVPKLILDAETEISFNKSIRKNVTISFGSWSTDGKTVDTQLEYEHDIGSARNTNSPGDRVKAHQAAAAIRVSNKANEIALFDNLVVPKCFVDVDGVRYARDGVSIDYASNDYLDQYRDLKLFKKIVEEDLISPV